VLCPSAFGTMLLSLCTPATSQSFHPSSSQCSLQPQSLCICSSLCQEGFSSVSSHLLPPTRRFTHPSRILNITSSRTPSWATCMRLLHPVMCSCGAKCLSFTRWCKACHDPLNYSQNVSWGPSTILGCQPQVGRTYLVHCCIHRAQTGVWHTDAPQ